MKIFLCYENAGHYWEAWIKNPTVVFGYGDSEFAAIEDLKVNVAQTITKLFSIDYQEVTKLGTHGYPSSGAV